MSDETPQHRRQHRKAYYEPPTMEEPKRYYVVMRPSGPDITSNTGGLAPIVGPVTFTVAVSTYVKCGGVAADLGLE